MSYQDVLDVFVVFEEFYYPHFCILEPVASLSKLLQDSELLFWSIVLVTARHHSTLAVHYERLLAAHAHVLGRTCSESIQSLLDLQAMLLLCSWPAPVSGGQLRDPSWMRLGMAINAARQMGLDKHTDEVLFGQRRTEHQLSRYPLHIRKMTWLKCFEMDIQMSCWLGLMPTLVLPQNLRTISSFCSDAGVPRDYAAMLEIHVQSAQSLLALGGGLTGDVSPTLVRTFNQAFNDIKITYASTWSIEAEITLLTAKVYLFALCLVNLDQDDVQSTNGLPTEKAFAIEVLQGARTSAVQLSNLLVDISEDLKSRITTSSHAQASHPLHGHPKHTSRIAFYTAIVLLRYLDSAHAGRNEEAEAARNAFGRVYQMYISCPNSREHMDASRNMEVTGRALGHNQWDLRPHVTTRMAASLMYNTVWAAAKLRGRDKLPEYSEEAARLASTSPESSEGRETQANFQAVGELGALPEMTAVTQGWESSFMEQQQQLPAFEFPFGAWDDAVYDSWMTDANIDWNAVGQLSDTSSWQSYGM